MKLNGYSGCELEILDRDGKKCVRKTAGDTSYNQRLQKQKIKQDSLEIPGFNVCKVYEDGYTDDHYFFIMEYINGKTLADEMELMELNELQDCMESFLANFVIDREYDNGSRDAFTAKIEILKHDLRSKYQGFLPPNVYKAVSLLESYQWEYVISSPCHGDMTMENILIQRGRMYLIDCLDSFYDSWMIDAAKLLQDAEYMWSYRNKYRSPNLCVRMTVFRDLLITAILEMPDGNELLKTVYHMVLLNFLRIVPYSNSVEDEEYLMNTIEKISKRITEEDYD